jgi:hypothetical protein
MQLRHILVAVAATAMIAGSSAGALAGKKHGSKDCGCGEGRSSSESHLYISAVSKNPYKGWSPTVTTYQSSDSYSSAKGDGEARGDASTYGGGIAVKAYDTPIGNISAAAVWGGTSASSCAGDC